MAPSLNLFKWPGDVKSLANNCDIIDSIVLKFPDDPIIKIVKSKFTKIAKFPFHQVTLVNVKKAINNINPRVGISQLIFKDNVICVSKP